MQRPSFALAVLFGALASGLLAANVAPCQVIVVFHASTEGPVEDVTAAEMPPAETPAAEEPPTEAPLADVALVEAPPSVTEDVAAVGDEAVATEAVATEATPASDPFDLTELLPASEPSNVAAPPQAEGAVEAPVANSSTKDDADWLLDELFDEPKQGTEGSTPRAEPSPAEESVASDESAASVESEATPVDMADVMLEPLQDAARDAAVTLDEAAGWMQTMAAGLRAWAGE
ncbi:MAG: hypothetical protein U0939_08100 [Pirellulales bacterium]